MNSSSQDFYVKIEYSPFACICNHFAEVACRSRPNIPFNDNPQHSTFIIVLLTSTAKLPFPPYSSKVKVRKNLRENDFDSLQVKLSHFSK